MSHGTDNFTIPQPSRHAGMSDNGKMSFCGLGEISEENKKCISSFTFALIFHLHAIPVWDFHFREKTDERQRKMLCVSADNETIRH